MIDAITTEADPAKLESLSTLDKTCPMETNEAFERQKVEPAKVEPVTPPSRTPPSVPLMQVTWFSYLTSELCFHFAPCFAIILLFVPDEHTLLRLVVPQVQRGRCYCMPMTHHVQDTAM